MELLVERKYARVFDDSPLNYYEFRFPKFTEDEKDLIRLVNKTALQNYSFEELETMFVKDKKKEHFVEQVTTLVQLLKSYSGIIMSPEKEANVASVVSAFLKQVPYTIKNKNIVIEQIISDLIGMSSLSYLLEDDELEEIMVNGQDKPVFVFDRTYGLCRTNISFDSATQIVEIIKRIASFSAREISDEKPLLDARLPDGSRVNATIFPASPSGPTITIRKFRKRPITITEMISNNTLTSDVAAFLWMCVDGLRVSPMNIIISGDTGSGKTMTLNALSVFVPQKERVISIEDTLELNLFNRDNWVQLEAKPNIFQNSLSIDDLLKNSIRMRPDRILVGEVRGEEANTMFTAMDIGLQGLMSTLHANSARETILRLQSTPMNVPTSMFTLLDLVLMQHRMYSERKGVIRRVTQISEVRVMGDHVLLNDLFMLNREKDVIESTNLPSETMEKLSFLTGLKLIDLKEEMKIRSLYLSKIAEQKIFDYEDIRRLVTAYWNNPSKAVKDMKL
jgi:flagellar protein FlaI